jgi:small subunit ribosomal protein S8e
MDQYHEDYRGKVSSGTGGRKVKFSDKRLCHMGGTFTGTRLSQNEEIKTTRSVGGNTKSRVRKTKFISVSTEGGNKKVEITNVIRGNTPDYTRQNIITKGAIVQTAIGKVRVTSRPGQHGVLSGVIAKE